MSTKEKWFVQSLVSTPGLYFGVPVTFSNRVAYGAGVRQTATQTIWSDV
jgi:hypothetical protein